MIPHWLAAYWNYLVILGLYKDALGAVVGGLVAMGIAHAIQWLPFSRRKRATQELIADRLDADTPGGIHDLVHGPGRTGQPPAWHR